MSRKEVLREVYNEIKTWETYGNNDYERSKESVLKYLKSGIKDETEKEEKQISPSGLILICDGKEYPVMLDLTHGYKFTCKEVTDEVFPGILELINFATGPINLGLKVEEKEAENIKVMLETEITTARGMIKTAKEFIKDMPVKPEEEKKPWSVFTLGAARGATI